jgi:hypothetical protein
MTHEKHGRHPAIGAEVESLKSQGWVIYVKKIQSVEHSNEHLDLISKPITNVLPVKRGRSKVK